MKMKSGFRTNASPKSATGAGTGNGVSKKPEVNRDRKEDRVTKMVFAMVSAFLVVWSPYAVAVIFTVAKVWCLNIFIFSPMPPYFCVCPQIGQDFSLLWSKTFCAQFNQDTFQLLDQSCFITMLIKPFPICTLASPTIKLRFPINVN